MKSYIILVCEICKSESKNPVETYACEAKCLGLSVDELKEYHRLRNVRSKKQTNLFDSWLYDYGKDKEKEFQKNFDEATEALLAFEEKHGLKDYEMELRRSTDTLQKVLNVLSDSNL